jgi:tyrosine-protein kinase Etk/Wzc
MGPSVIRFACNHMRETDVRSDAKEREDIARSGDSISLLDIIMILVKRRWLILGFTSIAVFLTLALLLYSVMAASGSWNPFPDIFMANAKVLIGTSTQGGSISSALSKSDLSALSGLLNSAGSGTSTNAELAKALLQKANVIKDEIAQEFDFLRKYDIDKKPKTKTREIFASNLFVEYDDLSGILQVGFADIDPEFAAKIANRTVELLMEHFSSLTLDKVTRKIQYLEQSIEAVERKSDVATQALIAFKTKYGITDASLGGGDFKTSSTQKIAQVEAQLFAKQIDLKLQSEYLPESDPRMVRLKNEIELMRKTLEELKKGSTEFSGGSFSTGELPELVVQYSSLSREAQIQLAILTTLVQQHELAKLEAMGTTQSFQIIEKAEVPEVKWKPSRFMISVIVACAALFISILAAFIVEFFQKAGLDPVEGEKLQVIRRMLPFRKKNRRG